MSAPKAGARIIAMEQRNSLLLVVVVAIGAIAVGLQAADEKNANYTVRILALPDHGQGTITMDYIAYDPKTGYVWHRSHRGIHNTGYWYFLPHRHRNGRLL